MSFFRKEEKVVDDEVSPSPQKPPIKREKIGMFDLIGFFDNVDKEMVESGYPEGLRGALKNLASAQIAIDQFSQKITDMEGHIKEIKDDISDIKGLLSRPKR